MPERPRGRERGEIHSGKGVNVKGGGLGTGPKGSSAGYSGRPGSAPGGRPAPSGAGRPGSPGAGRPAGMPGPGGRGPGGMPVPPAGRAPAGRRGRGGCGTLLIAVIVLAFVLLGGGSSGLLDMLSGGSSDSTSGTAVSQYGHSGTTASQYGYTGGMFGGEPSAFTADTDTAGADTGSGGSEGTLDTGVAGAARPKYTKILGGGKDTVTVMVYLCGTDLESRNGMATADLMEMTSASLGNVNLLVYTGGCLRWNNKIVSSRVNQIYKIEKGGLSLVKSDAGSDSMTSPDTLASFIRWCAQKYPANRNELILWDHGGGSVSGYGYDEKNRSSGSMTLAGISRALKQGGVTFDFIGFDTCLLGTAENALMLDPYADYLIASEESEPGVGWYYTDFLTDFAANTSMDTVKIGKRICDDFVRVCAKRCPGQATTLSVVDLAEFSAVVPDKLDAFSDKITDMISGKEYAAVSRARSNSREFAASSRIDQVDLVDLAIGTGTSEGRALAEAVRGAVKYNVINNITNASGVSIYFPYKAMGTVDKAVKTYNQIGMNASYIRTVQAFASLETAGQAASGGSGSPLGSLFGLGSYGGSGSFGGSTTNYGSYSGSDPYASYGSTGATADLIGELLGSFFGGDYRSVGLDKGNTAFLEGSVLDAEETEEYLSANFFDGSALGWEDDGTGQAVMTLADEQWEMVRDLDLNLWYDDGSHFVDLGLDNVFSFDEEGRLVADMSRAWLGVEDQVVAYYRESTWDDGTNYHTEGYIPCLINGEDAQLIVVFDNDHPAGYIAGARYIYKDGETDTSGKSLTELGEGDEIRFVADCYDYSGRYEDSYLLGDAVTFDGDLALTDQSVGSGKCEVTYRFTDIYNRAYWSEKLVL